MADCNDNCPGVAKKSGLSRRSLLLGLASVLTAAGISSGAEIANAAKTYTVAKKTAVPLRGGKLFNVGGKAVFITQPTPGVFRAFNAMCTHAGGIVNRVTGKSIVCPSHGAKFDTSTGQPVGGPAPKALARIQVTVSGNDLKVTI